jgi:putative transposase
LATQARGILAAGVVHVDTVLRRLDALITIEHSSRRGHQAGITANPDGARTTHAARTVLMDLGQLPASVKFLIRDRAGQFAACFDARCTAVGIKIPARPPRAPTANAICATMAGTLRQEVVYRLLIVNAHHLRRVLTDYLRHSNTARPHCSPGSSHRLKLTPGHRPSTRRAPDPPKTSPRRTHPRVQDRRLTAPPRREKKQVTVTIVYSSPTGYRI